MISDTKIAVLCTAEIQNEDIQSMIYPLQKQLSQMGWLTQIFSSSSDLYNNTIYNEGESSVFELIDYSAADAVIIYAHMIKNQVIISRIIEEANNYGKKVIVINENRTYEKCINIYFDEHDAFRSLVTHIVEEHNVKKINCIAGFKDNPVSEERIRVFREVLAEHDIPFSDDQLGYGDFYSFPTVQVMNRFLESPDGLPDAIVCINDAMAITVCSMLAEKGINVPEDIIVTGFDGTEQEKYNFPRLSTCRRDFDKLAETIIGYILSDETEGVHPFLYTPDFSESCGCKKRSTENINSAINSLYNRLNSTLQYERSMNNMVSKMTQIHSISQMNDIIDYYTTFSCYINVNNDFFSSARQIHNPGDYPFTDTMIGTRFFFKQDKIIIKNFEKKKLLPDWDEFLKTKEPVVILPIHNQLEMYGYITAQASNNTFEAFSSDVTKVQRFIMNLNTCLANYVQQRDLENYNNNLRTIQNKIIISFADLVESRDDFTGQHIKRTSEYLKVLVNRMSEKPMYSEVLTPHLQKLMSMAAPMHDIGKIKISDTVLNKPARLTDEEFEIIKTHATEGSKIIRKTLSNIESPDYLEVAYEMALYHHEKWDGSGYPTKLSGEKIPLAARIMAVVDVFDALTSKRVYKEAYPLDKAFNIIQESAGTHFDPDIISVFMEIRNEIEEVFAENQ